MGRKAYRVSKRQPGCRNIIHISAPAFLYPQSGNNEQKLTIQKFVDYQPPGKGDIMRTKTILAVLIIIASTSTFGIHDATAGFLSLPGLPAPPGLPGSPNVSVNIAAYLPAPPGVSIQISGGRPYYVEQGRRVYLKEKRHDKHHKGHGHKYGHYKQK